MSRKIPSRSASIQVREEGSQLPLPSPPSSEWWREAGKGGSGRCVWLRQVMDDSGNSVKYKAHKRKCEKSKTNV